jgi:hypothetical protein
MYQLVDLSVNRIESSSVDSFAETTALNQHHARQLPTEGIWALSWHAIQTRAS